MTSLNIALRVQHKRMTAAQWRDSEVILLEGEIGVESDTGYAKIGDGISRFSDLKYMQGPKGERGLQGPQGDPGQDGRVQFDDLTPQQQAMLKGPTGERGPQGESGSRGEQGETGPQGPVGPIGPKGERGDRGPQGLTGSDGPRGPVGPTGPKGETGPAGAPITTQVLTQAQYDALNPKSNTTLYLITG